MLLGLASRISAPHVECFPHFRLGGFVASQFPQHPAPAGAGRLRVRGPFREGPSARQGHVLVQLIRLDEVALIANCPGQVHPSGDRRGRLVTEQTRPDRHEPVEFRDGLAVHPHVVVDLGDPYRGLCGGGSQMRVQPVGIAVLVSGQ